MKKISILIAISALIFQGCALQTGVLNPHPDTNLVKTGKTIKQVLGEGVKNSFLIPEYNGIKNSKITDWHQTLTNGFENGFRKFYVIEKNNSTTDLTLKISKTDIKFIPVTLSGYNSSTVLKVQINFSAALFNKDGKEISKTDTSVFSKNTINCKGKEKEVVNDAVEKMYELIAKRLISQ